MTDHVNVNRDVWNADAPNWADGGARLWALDAPQWGIFDHPERDLAMLPEDMSGLHAIELGCGTAYVSGWMARRGAKVTAVDISAEQLATARKLAAAHGADIDFIEGDAEAVDRPDGAFDFAVSEYGAAIWCDPDRWVREAARLLRPGGRLAFLGTHPLALLCTPLSGAPCVPVLHRPYSALSRIDWTQVEIDPSGIEFARTVEGWLRLFRDAGFVVEDHRELFAPESASGEVFGVPAEWAKRYPVEQVWKLIRT